MYGKIFFKFSDSIHFKASVHENFLKGLRYTHFYSYVSKMFSDKNLLYRKSFKLFSDNFQKTFTYQKYFFV